MNKQKITESVTKNYTAFTDYIGDLPDEHYNFVSDVKWSAAQQLEHIILCVQPLTHIFGMDRETIQKTFGTSDHASTSYDNLHDQYLSKLRAGGKAPDRFVPSGQPVHNKIPQIETLQKLIRELCEKVNRFAEEDLDLLSVPHPLLGKLTLREMLYNMIDHVQHHHKNTILNLLTRSA